AGDRRRPAGAALGAVLAAGPAAGREDGGLRRGGAVGRDPARAQRRGAPARGRHPRLPPRDRAQGQRAAVGQPEGAGGGGGGAAGGRGGRRGLSAGAAQARCSTSSSTNLLPKKASTSSAIATSVQRTAWRPRQPRSQRPSRSPPNTSHDSTLSTVLCTRCWANRSCTNTTPVSRVAPSRTKPVVMVRN